MINKVTQSLRIKKPFMAVLVLLVVLGVGISVVQATLVSGGEIIDPPLSVAIDPPGVFNDNQQAFHEQSGVLLTGPVTCHNKILDPVLDNVERVNSHMIYFNKELDSETVYHDRDVTWTFENEILCIIKDDLYQVTTDEAFGIQTQDYYPGSGTGRGMETQAGFSEDDVIFVGSNQIKVTMTDEGPGDRLRVLTRWVQPPDETPPELSCIAEKGGVYEMVATDDRDESVSIYLVDASTEQRFGPVYSGMTIKHTQAQGGKSRMEPSKSKIDYMIKSPGELLITATDDGGNYNSAPCTN